MTVRQADRLRMVPRTDYGCCRAITISGPAAHGRTAKPHSRHAAVVARPAPGSLPCPRCAGGFRLLTRRPAADRSANPKDPTSAAPQVRRGHRFLPLRAAPAPAARTMSATLRLHRLGVGSRLLRRCSSRCEMRLNRLRQRFGLLARLLRGFLRRFGRRRGAFLDGLHRAVGCLASPLSNGGRKCTHALASPLDGLGCMQLSALLPALCGVTCFLCRLLCSAYRVGRLRFQRPCPAFSRFAGLLGNGLGECADAFGALLRRIAHALSNL